ncbi:MAG TPA: biotin/lipoyl-binding protein [Pirellulales bacterium]|nr:biotin/lipoyl-binding protein [Pirellulales bacterium]
MRQAPFSKPLFAIALVAALAIAGYFLRHVWMPLLLGDTANVPSEPASKTPDSVSPSSQVLLSDLAIANLGLRAKAVRPQTYWKTIQVPGMVVDLPGRSDRGVVSPVSGVVTKVNVFPGDTVRPGDVLFTIGLLSESLHQIQSDLFKNTQDIKLAEAQRKRLVEAGGAIAGSRIIEVENQITRLEASVQANRRELVNRGLTAQQIDDAADGMFATQTTIVVPTGFKDARPLLTAVAAQAVDRSSDRLPTYEVEELKVSLGQPVEAGQAVCLLANHQNLAIEGRAFRDETPLLERSVKEGWPVEVDFQEDATAGWPPLEQTFHIRQLANTIDPINRTFAFLIPLENQSRAVEQQGRTQMLWRFRPGQKLRVLIRVEKLDNVFVLPAEAVARDNPEAFVFTQNVNTFERKPIRVLSQDRLHVVIANDGSLLPGMFVVQNAAAQLNRMAKSQSSGVPKGYHVHADGSLHKNEDEGK